MESVLSTALDCARGVVDIEAAPDGVRFHRAPAGLRRRLADASFDAASGSTSGVRIAVRTDAQWIELNVELIRTVLEGVPTANSHFDLVVDGAERPSVQVSAETRVRVDPVTGATTTDAAVPSVVRFELGPTRAMREVEIWFPTGAQPVLRDVRVPAGATVMPSADAGPRWVHYGSSISQCGDVSRPLEAWPTIVARRSRRSLVNLGLAGHCQLDQGIARGIRGLDAAVITLEVGTNIVAGATMRERIFVSAFHAFLDTLRDGAPDTRVVVVSPIFCGALETRVGPLRREADGSFHPLDVPEVLRAGALSLVATRRLLASAVAVRRAEGDRNLEYVDGLDLFGAQDAPELYDGLHPTVDGYRRIAERFRSRVF